MIGSLDDLIRAAKGQPRKKPATTGGGGDVTSQFDFGNQYVPSDAVTALAERQKIAGAGTVGQDYGTPTATYGSLLSGTGGMSGGSGKYAGFNTEGALQNAIKGSAINFRTKYPENLRAEALKRYTDLGTMIGPGTKAITKDLFGGTQESYKQYQDYGKRLGSWYKENAAPAEEYYNTARQIEATPLSQLATQIASSKYGQNQDWATSTFSNLDAEYASTLRDQRYLKETGLPYDEYVARYQESERAGKIDEETASKAIEAATGLKGSYVSGVTARTSQQLVNNGLNATVQYKIPGEAYEGDQVSESTGSEAINKAKTFINSRNYQNAYDMAQSLEEEGYPDSAFIIYSMLKMSGASADLKNKLALSGIVVP